MSSGTEKSCPFCGSKMSLVPTSRKVPETGIWKKSNLRTKYICPNCGFDPLSTYPMKEQATDRFLEYVFEVEDNLEKMKSLMKKIEKDLKVIKKFRRVENDK